MKKLIVSLLFLGLTACDNNTAKEQARQKQIEALRKLFQARNRAMQPPKKREI